MSEINPVPSGQIIIGPTSDGSFLHDHSPEFGGEISWNDIQTVKKLNAQIKLINRERARLFMPFDKWNTYLLNEDGLYFPGKIPYIRSMDPSGFPVQAYNQHSHVNEYDGGYIAGAGNHDHRDFSHGGLAFSCFHPGNRLPLRNVRIE